jgi:hypothetical protein
LKDKVVLRLAILAILIQVGVSLPVSTNAAARYHGPFKYWLESLVTFGPDPESFMAISPAREAVRIAVYALVLAVGGWSLLVRSHRTNSVFGWVAAISLVGAAAGVFSTYLWGGLAWAGQASRSEAVDALAVALNKTDDAARQGFLVAIFVCVLGFVLARPQGTSIVSPPEGDARLRRRHQWITVAVTAAWVFIFGSTQFSDWANSFDLDTEFHTEEGITGPPSPIALLLRILTLPNPWNSFPNGTYDVRMKVPLFLIFFLALIVAQRVLTSRLAAVGDIWNAFLTRWTSVSIAVLVYLYAESFRGDTIIRHNVTKSYRFGLGDALYSLERGFLQLPFYLAGIGLGIAVAGTLCEMALGHYRSPQRVQTAQRDVQGRPDLAEEVGMDQGQQDSR